MRIDHPRARVTVGAKEPRLARVARQVPLTAPPLHAVAVHHRRVVGRVRRVRRPDLAHSVVTALRAIRTPAAPPPGIAVAFAGLVAARAVRAARLDELSTVVRDEPRARLAVLPPVPV